MQSFASEKVRKSLGKTGAKENIKEMGKEETNTFAVIK